MHLWMKWWMSDFSIEVVRSRLVSSAAFWSHRFLDSVNATTGNLSFFERWSISVSLSVTLLVF